MKTLPLRGRHCAAGILVLLVATSVRPCSAQAAPPFPHITARPHYLIGIALDRLGRPLKGVDVTVQGTTIRAGEVTNLTITSGSDGRFKLPLPDGVYAVAGAYYRLTYHGLRYVIKLAPQDGPSPVHFSSDDGCVQNFYVKLSGQIDPSFDKLHYGGEVKGDALELQKALASAIPKVEVTFTFTPVGPLVDGSPGSTIARRVTIDTRNAFQRFFTLTDVPVGAYRLSAAIVLPDGRNIVLAVSPDPNTNGAQAAGPDSSGATILFRPAEGGIEGTRPVIVRIAPAQ